MSHRRRPHDPHLDPLRAPSAAGQHPHVVDRSRSLRNPQEMYEYRDQAGQYRAQQVAAAHRAAAQRAQQQQGQPHILENPLIMLGLGALAAWALVHFTEKPRKNPSDSPPPPSTGPVVVIPPMAGPPVQVQQPQTVTGEVVSSREKTETEKPKRKRKTTQAHDSKTGRYLPAGSRSRAVTEGKKS